ncbi:MAG TPA: 16S rRNA (cytosine(1402)-N(4))-methyltransferase RsmH [Tepidisphaeraceae bacterium]|jgi:16S rRNA (cytosine1402-N4)-methyltransferase|nr:16S rRNA (cytosine(1402)-N(4))-methyltransferase RsmH [Tepidisphaeraceae bacterium]
MSDEQAIGHDPVLLRECLEGLAVGEGKTIVDCTLGRGGHSLAIAKALGPTGTLIALDADPRNLEFAQSRLNAAGIAANVRLFHANFAELSDVLTAAEVPLVDGILADLGISTNQLFDEQYGLSFAAAMPLDMRIDPRTRPSAADVVNTMKADDLANVLYNLADERYSRRIARKIVEARRVSPITTTDRLADLVRSAIPKRGGPPERIDPATRTFLALRMHVNAELHNLQTLLTTAPKHLKPRGRLAIISFQSTEDRFVKTAFRSADERGELSVITKKPVTPSDDELTANPRSRSAKLRIAAKV